MDLEADREIQEVAHSWYDYSGGKEQGLHPYPGETRLNYTGPKPPYEQASWKRRGVRWGIGSSSATGVDNYQAVVPSTWNAGPRDPKGQDGAYEAGLKGPSCTIRSSPVGILRTIHSFAPCIACAVHVAGPDGEELVQ